jgi:site-specific DNA-methyltransferase (adenine-specific)
MFMRSEESLSDEWETPKELFDELCDKYNIFPRLDPCATNANRKCLMFFTKEENALEQEWEYDVWCNPPHSITGEFVRKAHTEWIKNNINIMMLVPANTVSTVWWHECVEGVAEYHPVKGRIRFIRDGEPSKFQSRNAYMCVIFRKN